MSDAKKHIALVIVNLRPGMDGASSSMIELMFAVGRLGFKASIFNFFTEEPRHRALLGERKTSSGSEPVACNYKVYQYRERDVDCQVRFFPFTVHEFGSRQNEAIKTITETINKYRFDYVLTADRISLLTAHLMALPGCHFFHSVGNVKRVQSIHPAYLSGIRHRDSSTVSTFLQGKLKEMLEMDATLIKPVIDFEDYVATGDTHADAIGFYAMGLPGHKGDEIVNEIIKKMPETKFIIIGEPENRQFAPLPENVAYWGHQRDMREFYRHIKLLLVPSLVQEGFPRIILEAAANGIPAIANNRGGIAEALGDSGVLIDIDSSQAPDIQHIADCYVKEIQILLDNRDAYATMSKKALERAGQYQAEQENTLRWFFQHHLQFK